MSNSDIKSVSATTGQFPALTVPATTASGSDTPTSGKIVPPVSASKPDLEKLAASLNVASQSVGRDLRFQVNLNSRQTVIQVLDRETGEVIREIPPEKAEIYLAEGGDLALRLLDANI